MPSLLPHDLCHGRSSSCWLLAELHPPTLCKHLPNGLSVPDSRSLRTGCSLSTHCWPAPHSTSRLSCAGAPSCFSIPTKSPMSRGHLPAGLCTGSWGPGKNREVRRGPSSCIVVRAAAAQHQLLNTTKLVLHLCCQLTGSPGGSRTRPRPRQWFKRGGWDRRTWSQSQVARGAGTGTRGAGTHMRLGHTRGWLHVVHAGRLSGTQSGMCRLRTLETGAAPLSRAPGLKALQQAARCQRLRRPPTQRPFIPWMAVTIRAKG